MPTEKPCPPDAPVMVAWNAYKARDEYTNTRKWAQIGDHVDGSLWAAFRDGFEAASSVQTGVAVKALIEWIEQQRARISGEDGYNYASGEEYGLRRAQIEAERILSALSSVPAPSVEELTNWTPWTGSSTSPVTPKSSGYLRVADGEEFFSEDISTFNWRHDFKGPVPDRRIVAYRLARNSDAAGEGK